MVSPIALQKALHGADYPATKQQLIELAKKNGADQDVIDALNKLRDSEINGPNEVQKEVF
jgi:hypothetical protein